MLLVFFSLFDVTGAVLFLEPFYSAGGINEFLLAGVERMAHRAYLGVNFLRRAAGLESIAAAATNNHLMISWMYVLLHYRTTPKSINIYFSSIPKKILHVNTKMAVLLNDDFFGNLVGNPFIAHRLHSKGSPAGCGTSYLARIPEHLRQRNPGVDYSHLSMHSCVCD